MASPEILVHTAYCSTSTLLGVTTELVNAIIYTLILSMLPTILNSCPPRGNSYGASPLSGRGGPITLVPLPTGEGEDMVRGAQPLLNSLSITFRCIQKSSLSGIPFCASPATGNIILSPFGESIGMEPLWSRSTRGCPPWYFPIQRERRKKEI